MFEGVSIWQLLIILLILILLFGSKKIRGLGSDLGASIRSFKKAMHEDDDKEKDAAQSSQHDTVDSDKKDV